MMLHIDSQLVSQWLTHYGSIALFGLLALGIFGLPIPDETLLVFTGLLLAKGQLSLYSTLPAAYLGSMVGITLSYLLGYMVGLRAIHRFGRYVGVDDAKIKKAHSWYEKIGKWTLLFGYYLPGVRHLSGICAGTAYLTYWEFALFAYVGAFVWASTFLAIGYFFFSAWSHWGLHII